MTLQCLWKIKLKEHISLLNTRVVKSVGAFVTRVTLGEFILIVCIPSTRR